MTSLKLTMPDAETAVRLEADVVSTLLQKLAEFGFTPPAAPSTDARANVHHLEPRGSMSVDTSDNVVKVRLHSVDVDQKDLFTSVLADLEQRNDGVSGEIG